MIIANHPECLNINWEECTFEGAEREQLRAWSRLPLRAKLLALEGMCDHAAESLEWRRSRHLAYIDPVTGELVKSSVAPAS